MKQGLLIHLVGIGLLLALPLGVGWWAIDVLRFQQLSGCQSLKEADSQSDDAVAANFYCAQMNAKQQTVEELSEAIRMARLVPSDHPLAEQSDRLVEQVSHRLLEMADSSFQAGKLDEAIETARRIPVTTPVYRSAGDQIKAWQTTWDNAQAIFNDAQAFADRDNWEEAFSRARELRKLGNRYWETDRYQELVRTIQEAKEGKATLAKAERDRQKSIPQANLPLQSDPLANWQQQQDREANANLSRARNLASAGTVDGLRAATDAAGQVLYGTSHYEEAQRLIDQWNTQLQTMEDRPFLDRAVQLASKGDTPSLQAAIAEASNVSFGSALYQEAQNKIDQWTSRIQALHLEAYPDRPVHGNVSSPANYTIPPAKRVP